MRRFFCRKNRCKSVTCAVCGDKFHPETKDQRTCSRGCGKLAGRHTREAKRQERLASEYDDSSHTPSLCVRPPGGRALLTPPSNNEQEVSPAPTPSAEVVA